MAEEKILKDEILSEEQLEKVAGGTALQSEMDTNFLQKIGAMHIAGMNQDKPDSLEKGWAQMGVTIIEHEETIRPNEYFFNGKQIARIDALRLAAKKMKSKINVLDYDI